MMARLLSLAGFLSRQASDQMALCVEQPLL